MTITVNTRSTSTAPCPLKINWFIQIISSWHIITHNIDLPRISVSCIMTYSSTTWDLICLCPNHLSVMTNYSTTWWIKSRHFSCIKILNFTVPFLNSDFYVKSFKRQLLCAHCYVYIFSCIFSIFICTMTKYACISMTLGNWFKG